MIKKTVFFSLCLPITLFLISGIGPLFICIGKGNEAQCSKFEIMGVGGISGHMIFLGCLVFWVAFTYWGARRSKIKKNYAPDLSSVPSNASLRMTVKPVYLGILLLNFLLLFKFISSLLWMEKPQQTELSNMILLVLGANGFMVLIIILTKIFQKFRKSR